MRSEKEIKEKDMRDFIALSDGTFDLLVGADFVVVRKVFDWVLEGEPRYSVAELEKIVGSEQIDKWFADEYKQDIVNGDMQDLLDFLKDQARVEAILK